MNFANRTIFISDNLPVLENLNSKSVDLVYLDPPFNSRKNYKAQIGSAAEGAKFSDVWKMQPYDESYLAEIHKTNIPLAAVIQAARCVGGDSDAAYLIFMAQRLMHIKRILKNSGSVYLHCNLAMSHSLKLMMDAIFGRNAYRNEIVWHYGGTGKSSKKFLAKHDVILFYGKTLDAKFNPLYVPAKVTSGWTGKKEKLCDAVWQINTVFNSAQRNKRTGYPTEKPEPLIERIIQASSDVGDVVLDPFCGGATTCIVAEKLSRQWIAIDQNENVSALLKMRLDNTPELASTIWQQVQVLSQPPIRNDSRND